MSAPIEYALASHPGLVRGGNEDAVGVDAELGLAVLADGLGGYNAGEVASAMAVSRTLAGLREDWPAAGSAKPDIAALLRRRLDEVNAAIATAAQEPESAGMATTLVVAWLRDGRWWVAHVGDSRAYRFSSGKLQPLTRDHSYLQELASAGVISGSRLRRLPGKNLVTRALGAARQVEIEINAIEARQTDWLLLCSDGLHDMLNDADIAAELAATLPDPRRAARRLIDRANAAGGHDNCSVILLRAKD